MSVIYKPLRRRRMRQIGVTMMTQYTSTKHPDAIRLFFRRYLLTAILGILIAFSSIYPAVPASAASGEMQITPIDYGHADGIWGDCTLVTSGGKTLLMDTCLRDKYDTLINYLDDHHFYNFDIYLSHYHYDHMHQIPTIINDSRFRIGKVYLPDPAYIKTGAAKNGYCKDMLAGYNSIVRAANDNGIQIVYLKKGSSFKLGNATVRILWGCSFKSSNYNGNYINNNSLVAKITSGSVSYLTCGDIEKETENQLVNSGIDLRADIFKMSHHGGNTSNTKAFVQKVNPSFAFYTWDQDSPTSFGGGWVQTPINNLKDTCNIYSSRYNGMLNFCVKAGHISVAGERNMRTVTANIKDSAGNIVNRVVYQFNDALDYHITAAMKKSAATVTAANASTALPKRYKFTAKFVKTSEGYKYRKTDGSFIKSKLQKIGSYTYYFDSKGVRQTGFKNINKKTYYFDKNGRMLLRWKRINGKKYFFDPVDGHMHTGWEWVEEKNGWYYLHAKKGYLVEGWKTIGGKKYYFTKDQFYAKTGWQTIGGKKYYFDTQNAFMITGWKTIGSKTYYFGKDGVMVTGNQTIGGKLYTFNNKGQLNGKAPSSATTSTTKFSSKDAGSKIIWSSSPFVTSSLTNTWAKGTDKDLAHDHSTVRNTAFVNSMLSYATFFVNKVDYASSVTNNDPNGLRFKHLKKGGKTDCSWFVYHVLHKYGLVEDFVHSYEWGNKPSTYPGGVNIGTDISLASPGDIICTGKGTQSNNSHVMLYLGNNRVVECAAGKGVIISKAPSNPRQIVHFSCLPKNNSAAFTKSSKGTWVKSGKGYKFRMGSSYLTNRFQNINGSIYYFGANGLRVTGWKKIQGKKYYFDNEGKMYLRWKRINGKKYYFDPLTGYMHTGWEFVKELKNWYYLSTSKGYLLEGWQKIDGKTYYFTPGDFYAKTGWQTIGGKKYYFASDCHMVTGTVKIGSKTYNFGTDGVLK